MRPLRIASLDTFQLDAGLRGDWLLVRLSAADGLAGIGEASQSGDDAAATSYLTDAGRHLEGRTVNNIPTIMAELKALVRDRAGTVALSGVEQALWDLLGQATATPVVALLGGPRSAGVRVYANINREATDRSPDAFATSASRAVAKGFRAVKCNPFDGVNFSSRYDPGSWEKIALGLDRVAAVRRAIGSSTALMVDCHSRFDGRLALRVARALQSADMTWFEDPVPPDDLDGLRYLRTRANVPLATGETLHGARAFWPLFREHLVDYVLPDVKMCGGVQEMMVIGHAASVAGVPLAPHNPSGPISTLISAHIVGAHANGDWLEVAIGEVPWRATLIQPHEHISENSMLAIRDAPGLGVTLNASIIEQHCRH